MLPWLTPNRRRLLLALGAVWVAVRDPVKEVRSMERSFSFTPDTAGLLLVLVALIAFVWAWYRVARRFASLPTFVKRHPQLCLHGCF